MKHSTTLKFRVLLLLIIASVSCTQGNGEGPTAVIIAPETIEAGHVLAVDATTSVAGSRPITTTIWDFGDGTTASRLFPHHTYLKDGVYTVTLTVSNAFGSDAETKTDYVTVTSGGGGGTWQTITYDDFEAGWGNYTDGGGDCSLYVDGSYAHQGSNAADIQDNSGVASSFYHTNSYNLTGYTEVELDFYFIAVSMDNSNEDFWLQVYDGSSWVTVGDWDQGTDFDNGTFYHVTVNLTPADVDRVVGIAEDAGVDHHDIAPGVDDSITEVRVLAPLRVERSEQRHSGHPIRLLRRRGMFP